MSLALYRKYRSRTLDEVLGQDHVTGILTHALKKGKIAHAYLLTGPRGTGKTSVARILAYEIAGTPYSDDGSNLDIIEIDAASNNGVDDIRNLREKAQVAPVAAKSKVYIIDEVHMLSKAAFNALLKTLEEPPAHVVFILATTDADKLPSTILSRVQQFYFHPIATQTIADHLVHIAKQEGFTLTDEAAHLIAERSRGGFRDSISMLDQLSVAVDPSGTLDKEHVAASFGLANDELITTLIGAHESGDAQTILATLQSLEEQGASPLITTNQLLSSLRQQLATKPHLVTLITRLIEVTKHSHPDLKLLSALMPAYAAPKQTAPPAPAQPQAATPTPAPVKQATPAAKAAPVTKKVEPVVEEKPSEPAPAAPVKRNPSAAAPTTFDWDSFLKDAKTESIGLFSLLSKCGHSYGEGTLTLYAGTSFTQKKLEDAKNRPIISKIVNESGDDGVHIVITNEKKPPADEKLAAVAAMMGGGEEVNLENMS